MYITIRKLIDEQYRLSDGKLISSKPVNTLTTVKSILLALGFTFDEHGNNSNYRKIMRLINKGVPIHTAVCTILKK
ncbi:hypothetical protein PS1M3_37480 [Pseudoalteromonas sp. PS1M3]|jgi:hypothetical protein|uniref:hypothetical protein n=1 Tax=Pseudoalteromonas sp. PS1M3 TaxID=87791 RepID=UPI001952161A|nr:hypothetical protein [Pseudoalteromonas sp. PS1M3]BBW93661.1 hypothetical protein PS1M3_37480 [Pseudoalteromonas sp. PS1M3]